MTNSQKLSFTIFFLLSSLEAFGAIFLLYTIPSDPKNAQIFGISTSRLILLLFMLSIALLFYYLGWYSYKKAAWLISLEAKLMSYFSQGIQCFAYITTFFILFANSLLLYFLIIAEQFGEWQASLFRLSPIILWTALFFLQAGILFCFLFLNQLKTKLLQVNKSAIITLLITFSILIIIALIINTTGIGILPDIVAWGAPGTPILLWQGMLTLNISWFIFLLGHYVSNKLSIKPKWYDTLLSILLWLCAVLVWQNTSFTSSYFAPQPVPPNFEFYPYSDASLYDVNAQYLLIGEGLGGYGGTVIRRPLYSLFLAFIHLGAGQQYNKIVFIQILFLALMPVFLYYICALIHTRFSGLLCALLFIYQEHNAISLSNVINVSHSKLLMSDPFTALWIMAYVLAILAWKRRQNYLFLIILSGGFLGAAMLVRPQAAVLLLLFLISILLEDLPHFKKIFIYLFLFFLGIICVISPWIIRNYHLTSTIVFDEPSSAQTGMIAQRNALSPSDQDEAILHLPGEKEGECSARMTRQIVDFTIKHPSIVASFAASHFFHNIVNLINTLPISYKPINPEEYVRSLPYWLDLDRKNYQIEQPYSDKISLGLVFLLLSLGLASTFIISKSKGSYIYGFIPLVAYLLYNLSNAISRNSGWRFLLPSDWVGLVYYSCGFTSLLLLIKYVFHNSSSWFFSAIQPASNHDASNKNSFTSFRNIITVIITLTLFGSLIPISERLFPTRYPTKTKQEIIEMLSNSEWAKNNPKRYESLYQIGLDESTFVLWGRALYPRYYPANGGITSGSPNPLTRIRDYNRLSFHFISHFSRYIILPINNPPPQFPNGSDVIVIGCNAGDHISAYLAAYAVNTHSSETQWHVFTQDIAAIPFCQ